MPTRDHRRAQQVWRNNHQDVAYLRQVRHARDLAHLAGILADVHGCPVEGQGLIVSRLAGPGGIIVWHSGQGRPLLHITAAGQLLYYEAGEWEQRLVKLVQEVTA